MKACLAFALLTLLLAPPGFAGNPFLNAKSDVPRFVKLVDMGLFDAKSMVTASYPLDRTREAFQAVADRTTACAVVVFV